MVGSADRGATRAVEGSRSLEPGDFSFYEFGDLRRDELRKILRLGIRTGEPGVSTVDGAVFVPDGYEAGAGQPKYAGGIVKSDGSPIETAQMHRKGGKRFGGFAEAVPITPERELDEEVIYLGLLFNHYGRVLLESLARVWYLDRIDPAVKIVFNSANAAQAGHAPWLPAVLSLFGVPPERMLTLDRPTRLRRAIVPEPLFEQFYSAHEEMVRPFRDVAARVAGDVTPSAQPLYLSRGRLTSRQRPVVGEIELETLLRANGFLIVSPETMSIEDQVRLVNSHTDIFSSTGSAAHSILFSLHRPRLHLLTSRDDIPANYFLCSALADAPTTIINCLTSDGRASASDNRLSRRGETPANEMRQRPVDVDAGPQSMPQLFDLARTASYLAEQGFITDRAPAVAASPGSSLQRRFAEAWVYARLRKAATRSTLPDDLREEAVALASSSWPVSLMLARYYARTHDRPQTNAMALQFATLAGAETDSRRLAYYRGDVLGMASRIARMCKPQTAELFRRVLADRFPADGTDDNDDGFD